MKVNLNQLMKELLHLLTETLFYEKNIQVIVAVRKIDFGCNVFGDAIRLQFVIWVAPIAQKIFQFSENENV